MTKLSGKVINEVMNIAPAIRKRLANELVTWNGYYAVCAEFYSDKVLLEMLPYAAYEYIVLAWNIEANRLNREASVEALNNKAFKDINNITAHALRQIACIKCLKQPHKREIPVSNELALGVIKLLPELRKNIVKEFAQWNASAPGSLFYDDERVMNILLAATYEYLIISRGIQPLQIDTSSVLHVIENKLSEETDKIVTHALRRLASIPIYTLALKNSV